MVFHYDAFRRSYVIGMLQVQGDNKDKVNKYQIKILLLDERNMTCAYIVVFSDVC